MKIVCKSADFENDLQDLVLFPLSTLLKKMETLFQAYFLLEAATSEKNMKKLAL